MKVANAFLVMFLIACVSSSAGGAIDQPMPKQSDEGIVYYFGFEIERITGIPENQIEQYGCKFNIGRNDFEQSLSTAPIGTENVQYNRLDIRAKVIFFDKQYFIDRMGVVSGYHEYRLLDRAKFVGHLRPLGEC